MTTLLINEIMKFLRQASGPPVGINMLTWREKKAYQTDYKNKLI